MNDFIEMFKLGSSSIFEQDLGNKEDIVHYNKKYSQMKKTAQTNAKKDKCFICKKQVTNFCNSHAIPRFALKNISSNGYIYTASKFTNTAINKHEAGINKADTFRLICENCDNTLFQEYENPNSYDKEPSNKMLAQIALKNYLRSLNKQFIEIEIYKIAKNEHLELSGHNWEASFSWDDEIDLKQLDIQGYMREFAYAKNGLSGKWNKYKIIYSKMLNYVVPIAFQSKICLISDIDGQLVNNIYNQNPKYKMSEIHIFILPLKTKSFVLLFVRNDATRYKKFIEQFNNLNEEDKLSVISFIVCAYSEDYFISKAIKKSVIEKLSPIAQLTDMTITINPVDTNTRIKKACEEYNLSKHYEYPNLLSALNQCGIMLNCNYFVCALFLKVDALLKSNVNRMHILALLKGSRKPETL